MEDNFKHYFYHAPFLKNYNNGKLREDPIDDGVFDDKVNFVLHQKYDDVPENHEYRSRYSYQALHDHISEFLKKSRPKRYIHSGFRLAKRKFAPHLSEPLVALRLDDPNFYAQAKIKGEATAGLTAYGMSKSAAFARGMDYAEQILNGKTPHPCLAYDRTQNTNIIDVSTGKKRPKTRLIWGYPLEMTILESCIARPLIDFYLDRRYSPMSFGLTSAQMSTDFQWAKNTNQYILGTDQSAFDQHVGRHDIKECFGAWRSMFDLHQTVDLQGHTVGDVFDIVERYFIYTPLVYPDKKGCQLTRDKDHGVPSGSYFTQMLDSFVNYALTVQLFHDMDVKFNENCIFVLGDDMISFIHSKVNLASLAGLAKEYGYQIHLLEKSEFKPASAHEFSYLGRVWRDCVPVRTYVDVVDRAQYPERRRDYSKDPHPLQTAAGIIYSYGLSAVILGVDWERGNLIPVPRRMLSGYMRYLDREVGLFRGNFAVSTVY